MDNAREIFEKSILWVRLAVCVKIHVKKALLNVVFNEISEAQVTAIPSDSVALYTFLQSHKNKIENSKHIKAHQKSILLPTNSQSVDSSTLDISLIRFLIQTFNGIKNANKDWKEPAPSDKTLCAYVFRAANFRNQIFHDNDDDKMDEITFEEKWEELKKILQGLKYVGDIEQCKTLKYEKLKCVMLEEFVDHLRSYKEECSEEPTQDDYIRRRFHVEENKSDIVTEADLENLIKDNDRLVIYGEAGIGKSSTARHIKKEWHNGKILNDYHVIYYDSKRINKQLTVQSAAAPIYFSELGDYLIRNKRTIDDLSIYNCVKTAIDDLIILIDGIDEFPVRELVNEEYIDELERKVINNEKINGTETIIAIYFGFLFPYSKIFLLGRISEFESLKKVKVNRDAAIFNRKTINLELLKFDDENVKDFTCSKICKQKSSRQTICTGACQKTYNKIKNIDLCKIPTDLNSLIELCKKHPNENIGKITRTKLIIASLLNRLNEHVNQKNYLPCETFEEINKHKNTFIDCIRCLVDISFNAVYKGDITIRVEKETINETVHFQYESRIKNQESFNVIRVERKILEELDLFYIRDFNYYFILEPHHTLTIEFLSACYLFSHPDEWDSILKLKEDRQLVIISCIAGLHAEDNFTKDFVKNVLKTSGYSLEQFLSWLYDVEDVRRSLPDGGRRYKCWFGLMENQKLSPSFSLLDSISHEVEIPQTFIPKTIVCYRDLSPSFEWYNMDFFKHNSFTKLSGKIDIESFSKKFPSFRFIIKGTNIEISNADEFNRLNRCVLNNLITFKINKLFIWTSLETYFSSKFNLNSLFIWKGCDKRTIDMILNAFSPPNTNTSSSKIPIMECKRLGILDITKFNPEQTEKLFTLGLPGVVDCIALWDSTFFEKKQIKILKNMEQETNKLNIELNGGEFNCIFRLPNLGKRHISLHSLKNVTENYVIELRKHIIPSGYSNNLAKYKIIDGVPFVRKENYSGESENSMFLNLYAVSFRRVSPEVFADTFSLIPSFACYDDNDDYISTSQWWRLSHTNVCKINEMRIWNPQLKNLEHFLTIKTIVIQFMFWSKDRLEQLLNHIINDSNVKLVKEIKVFVVKFDECNWDYYEEITLFGGKSIEEYKDNCSADDLLLDNISVPFHDGEKHLKSWCCEITQSSTKNINLVTTGPDENYSMTSYC